MYHFVNNLLFANFNIDILFLDFMMTTLLVVFKNVFHVSKLKY